MIPNVLYVDDDRVMLSALQSRLEKYRDSFAMVPAEDGFEAVYKLREIPVALVVLDLKMSRMDGVGLLSHISDKYPEIPIIIVSGYRLEEVKKLVKDKEVAAFVSKPFQVEDLAKIVLSTLRREAEGGTLRNVSPVVFLQLMEMESRTCTVQLIDRATQKRGVLFFRDGKLYDARVDQAQGINAAYIIFAWEEVTLFIRNECTVTINVINSSLQPIIMKAVGMRDEQQTEISEEEDLIEIGDLIQEESPIGIGNKLRLGKAPGPVGDDKKPQLDTIRDLLLKEVGDRCGLEDVRYDSGGAGVIRSINELGIMFSLGPVRVGSIDRGKTTSEILLPGERPIIITVSSKCPQDKILRVLSNMR